MFVNGYYEVGDTATLSAMGWEVRILGFTPGGLAIVKEVMLLDQPEASESLAAVSYLTPVWPLKPAPGLYWVQRPDDPEPWLVEVVIIPKGKIAPSLDEVIRMLQIRSLPYIYSRITDIHKFTVSKDDGYACPKDFPPDTQWWPVVKPEGLAPLPMVDVAELQADLAKAKEDLRILLASPYKLLAHELTPDQYKMLANRVRKFPTEFQNVDSGSPTMGSVLVGPTPSQTATDNPTDII